MNAHSRQGRCQGFPTLLDESRRPLFANAAVDRGHHVGARSRRSDGIYVEVKVRDLNSEFEQHGPFASGLTKKDTFCFAMNPRKVRELRRFEAGDVLHVALPDDHRVPGDAAVRMKRDCAVIILMDERAEAGKVVDRLTEAAMH
ncbi:MAG TPA: hypothetical protein VFM36_14320 [Thermoanaerobaculia bacterium]|nr:hypothetical protein [Thermoanaerobaculia bacterium]